jgi:hypothetical protein
MTDSIVNNNELNDQVKTEKEEFVPKKAYVEVSADMHKYKSKTKELEAELNKFRAEKEQIEQERLAEQGKFKELYEKAQMEKNELVSKWNNEKQEATRQQKLNAALSRIGKLVKPEFAQHINLDAITTTEAGQIDNDSLEAEVTRFKQHYGMCIQSNVSTPIPSTAPVSSKPGSVKQMKPMSNLNQAQLKELFKQTRKNEKTN